jgi:hypothetical protein
MMLSLVHVRASWAIIYLMRDGIIDSNVVPGRLLADLSLAAQLRGFSVQLRGFNMLRRYHPAGSDFSSMAETTLNMNSDCSTN